MGGYQALKMFAIIVLAILTQIANVTDGWMDRMAAACTTLACSVL